MPDPAPAPLTIPNFRDREKYPTRPANHEQSFAADFRALVAELSRREGPPEIAPRPLADPALSPAAYEQKYRELRYRLSRG